MTKIKVYEELPDGAEYYIVDGSGPFVKGGEHDIMTHLVDTAFRPQSEVFIHDWGKKASVQSHEILVKVKSDGWMSKIIRRLAG